MQAVHLTLGSNRGVGQHLNYQYCTVLTVLKVVEIVRDIVG